MASKKKPVIGVIGSSHPTDKIRDLAFHVGQEITKQGAILICGGRTGVMEASCQGAGAAIGILPGDTIETANPYVTVPIATGIGEARNLIIIRSSNVFIAVGGGYGTLSEIAFALKLNKPVIGLETWELNKISSESLKIITATNAVSAVAKALAAIK